MRIFDKVTNAINSVTDETKPTVDVGNLRAKIFYGEERIVEILVEMSKSFYKNFDGGNRQVEAIDAELTVMFAGVKHWKTPDSNEHG